MTPDPCPLIRRLYALDDGDYGYSAAELAPLHALCGALPAVLAHYYRTLGKHRELNHTQDDLLTPDVAAQQQAPGHLVFYNENQGCCVWGIRHADLHLPDPPVWVSEDRQHWQQESATTSAFLLAMAHLQAMFALPYGGDDGFYQLDGAARTTLERHFRRKPFGFAHWLCGIAIYGNHDSDSDSIVLLNASEADTQLKYASSDAARFAAMDVVLSRLGEPL